MQIDMADKVRQARLKAGLTPQTLARLAGITDRTIHRIEKGGSCSVQTLVKLAEALGYPPAFFLS